MILATDPLDWTDLALQAPGLAVIAFLVIHFLRHLTHRDEAQASRDEAFRGTLKEIHDGQLKIQERTTAALDKNTEALARVEYVLEQAPQK